MKYESGIAFISGVLSGLAIFGICFALILYPNIKDNWRNQGINEGQLAAKHEIFEKLESEFGQTEIEHDAKVTMLFRLKTSSAYIIKKDGKKSITVVD